MPDDGPFRPQSQRDARRPHAVEVDVLRALFMHRRVGVVNGGHQCRRHVTGAVFVVRVRNRVDGDLAGQLADRVPTHAVGHDEQMPARLKGLGVRTEHHHARVLVVAATKTNIALQRILDFLFPPHGGLLKK